MSDAKCPGQDTRFLKAEDVAEARCPRCGRPVEFWPDEVMRKCRGCGHRFANPTNSMKCLNWCRHAAQCLEAMRGGENADLEPLREELLERMRRIFDGEQSKIDHTLDVLDLTERIGVEVGADPLVVVPAAILHDIGRARPQPDEGPAEPTDGDGRQVAEVLADIDLPPAVKDEIADLVEHHHERDLMASRNGSALFDADLIVNLRGRDGQDRQATLATEALTDAGRRIGTQCLTPES
jgi:putative nucleotidyltransferase with HDIG domain